MTLVVGLGNPGKKYAKTKHNVGFLVVDEIGEKVGIELNKKKFKGIYGEGAVNGGKLLLLKPETFMNLSGEAVSSIKNFYDIPTDNIIVVHDEMDLGLGIIRIKSGGGSAGHNGIKSIISRIGSEDFKRVRIGIGKPLVKDEGADHVLKGFKGDQDKIIQDTIVRAAEAVLCIMSEGLEKAMNKYNTRNSNRENINQVSSH
jgi:PTH1 family peptidyl-tRNA hydrolase